MAGQLMGNALNSVLRMCPFLLRALFRPCFNYLLGAFDESVANLSCVWPGRAAEYDTDPDDGTRLKPPFAHFAYSNINMARSDIVKYRRSSGG